MTRPRKSSPGRWIAAALLALLLAVYFYTIYGYIVVTRVKGSGSTAVCLGAGALIIDWLPDTRGPGQSDRTHWLFDRRFGFSTSKRPTVNWWPRYNDGNARTGRPRGYSSIIVPLWIPLLALAGATGLVWFTHARRQRRELLAKGVCPRCGYSRSGISLDTACPECGDAPASAGVGNRAFAQGDSAVPSKQERPPLGEGNA